MNSRRERQLKKNINQTIQTTKQMQVLEELHAHFLEHLCRADKFSIVNFDTVLYELYGDPRFHYSWATSPFQHWLERNEQIVLEQKQSRMFRYLFVPTVDSISNPWLKKHFSDVVALNLHVNLWHGVVACVVFIDPKKYPPAKFAARLNFSYIPIHRMCFATSEFYQSSSPELSVEEDAVADGHAKEACDVIRGAPSPPIWLWYDDDNFSTKRLSGSRWDAMRNLFYNLCPKPFVCPICHERDDFTLDHILPVADGHFQTLMNMMGVCEACNRFKGDRYGRYDPFACPKFVPDLYDNAALRSILRDRPRWLGSVPRPSGVNEIRRITL